MSDGPGLFLVPDEPQPFVFQPVVEVECDGTDGTADRVEVAYRHGEGRWTVEMSIMPSPEFAEYDGDNVVPSEFVTLPPVHAFALAEMITHAATYAADGAGLCLDCGEPLHEHEDQDDSWRWTNIEGLAGSSDQLDTILAFTRQRAAEGEPMTTSDICQVMMRTADKLLAEGESPRRSSTPRFGTPPPPYNAW
jgi:hypothetical protein